MINANTEENKNEKRLKQKKFDLKIPMFMFICCWATFYTVRIVIRTLHNTHSTVQIFVCYFKDTVWIHAVHNLPFKYLYVILRILFGYTQYTFYRSNIYMLLRILFGYTQYTFYGSSSALVFYLLAWKLKRNNRNFKPDL